MQPSGTTRAGVPSEHIRSIVWDVIWSCLTCGIFNVYVQKRQMLALNAMLNQQKYSFWAWFWFSLITCGLYHIYHEYRMGGDILAVNKRANEYLPLLCLGLSIAGLTVIADAVQQFHINQFYGNSAV